MGSAADFTQEELESIKQGNEKCREALKENIGWKEEPWPEIPKFEHVEGEALVEAYPIMGIEKYMGNADKAERIAYFPQIKMCHDTTKTIAYVKFDKSLKENLLIVDDKIAQETDLKGMDKFVKKFREWTGCKTNYLLISKNFEKVKAKGKGLGTSAAAGGALAYAFTQATMPKLLGNKRFLSVFSRYFGGSSTSSVAGGWSIWLSHKGIDYKDSYGVRLDNGETKLRVVAVPIPSKIKTEDAHGSGEKSEWYTDWAVKKPEKCIKLMEAIKKDDVDAIGRIAELDSLNLFHILVSGNGFFNWEPETLELLRKVNMLRKERGLTCYASMDTGPSLAIITTKEQAEEVKREIEAHLKEMGREKDYPAHFVDIAGEPKILPSGEKGALFTDAAKGILKEKGVEIE